MTLCIFTRGPTSTSFGRTHKHVGTNTHKHARTYTHTHRQRLAKLDLQPGTITCDWEPLKLVTNSILGQLIRHAWALGFLYVVIKGRVYGRPQALGWMIILTSTEPKTTHGWETMGHSHKISLWYAGEDEVISFFPHIKQNTPFKRCVWASDMFQVQFRRRDSGLAGSPVLRVDAAKPGRIPRSSRLHEIIKLSLALWLEAVERTAEGTGVEIWIKEKNVAGKRFSGSAGGGHDRCVFDTLSHPDQGEEGVFISVIVKLLDLIMWFSICLNRAHTLCP